MTNVTTICIATMFALGVLFSYVLVHATGEWARCHWFGKGCILMLAVMACQSGYRQQLHEVQPRASTVDPVLLRTAAMLIADVDDEIARVRHETTLRNAR